MSSGRKQIQKRLYFLKPDPDPTSVQKPDSTKASGSVLPTVSIPLKVFLSKVIEATINYLEATEPIREARKNMIEKTVLIILFIVDFTVLNLVLV